MKKSQMLSRKTWRLVAKNLIILAVLVVVAFVGVMSWFTKTAKATADGINVKTEIVDGLEYYIVAPSDSDQYKNINDKLASKNLTWHTSKTTFNFKDSEFKFMEDLFLCEVTGDGNIFKIPKLVQYGEIAYVDTTSDFTDALANENYMSFDIYFRTKNQHTVTMKSGSSIAPTGAINPDTEDGIKNAAIGAVRMAVLKSNKERQLLWIPGPNVWYDGLDNNGEGKLKTQIGAGFGQGSVTFDGNGLKYTGESTTTHAYYTASGASKVRNKIDANGTNVIANTAGNYQLGQDVSMVTLNQWDSATKYYYGRVRINLWIEGEDAEARLKCVGGKFDMTLKFGLTG